MQSEKTKDIDQLNSFLRGEISAVETYRQALDKLEQTSQARAQLEACRSSHQQRVQMLRQAIQQRGGQPSEGSGAWGSFAKVVEGGAKVFGEKAAIAALEEGEDHGLRDYKQDLDNLDAETLQLVTGQLLPQQEETHRTLSRLKKTLPS